MASTMTSELVSKVAGNVRESVADLHGTLLASFQERDTKPLKAAGNELLENLRQRLAERPVATLASTVVLGVLWSRLLAMPSFRLGVARGLGALVASSLLSVPSAESARRKKLTLAH